jgi:hypothetical protein
MITIRVQGITIVVVVDTEVVMLVMVIVEVVLRVLKVEVVLTIAFVILAINKVIFRMIVRIGGTMLEMRLQDLMMFVIAREKRWGVSKVPD